MEVFVRSIFSLVVLLVAMVIALILFSRQAKQSVSAVKSVTFVHDVGAPPRAWNANEADRAIARLRELCDVP